MVGKIDGRSAVRAFAKTKETRHLRHERGIEGGGGRETRDTGDPRLSTHTHTDTHIMTLAKIILCGYNVVVT